MKRPTFLDNPQAWTRTPRTSAMQDKLPSPHRHDVVATWACLVAAGCLAAILFWWG